jgi:hypothetical protein
MLIDTDIFVRRRHNTETHRQKWLRSFGQFFLGINKVTALRFQAAIAAPVLLK